MFTASPADLAAVATDRARINKTNAQRSTGPKTVGGKTRSSLNAVKTGLTSRTVLLPSDDEEAYRNHVDAYVKEFSPVGVRESALVQSLADHAWRLDRIVTLEMSIYAVGHATLASTTDEHRTLIQYRTHLAYEKQLRNLHIQESRLRRHREKDLAELKQLQQIRRDQEAAAQSEDKSPNSPQTGFVFSTAPSHREKPNRGHSGLAVSTQSIVRNVGVSPTTNLFCAFSSKERIETHLISWTSSKFWAVHR